MLTLFKWLVRIVSGLLLTAVAIGALMYYFAARSLPDYDATFEVEGLSAPVEIVRSTENVPHIFGANDADVYFGLGLAHAQDRLWQMVMARRTVQGRLSEVFGAQTLQTDELMRRLDLYGAALASVSAQDPQTTIALEAYAKGVNQWITQVNSGALGRGAPEFFWFTNEIAYWTPADSIAILKLMALKNTSQIEDEVLRARLSKLSPDLVRDVMPDVATSGQIALPDYASLFNAPVPNAHSDLALPALWPAPSRNSQGASNAFAAAPERSAAGGSLLANDPHSQFAAPTQWYLARLQLQSGGVIGATIPGFPAILAGRNAHLGWGLTTTFADDQDVVMEALNPDVTGEYLTDEGSKPFATRRAILTVKDAAPITLMLRWSENGPILPGSHFDLADVTPRGHVAALQWTALEPADTSSSAAIALMQAHSMEQAVQAGEAFVAPVMNLTLADQTGIGMVTVGALPARDALHETKGRMPAPGTNPSNLWPQERAARYLPYAQNPQSLRPVGGIVGNTNNKITDRAFPDHVSYAWGDTQRIQRLQLLLGEREVHTRESLIAAQLDTVSPAARGLLPLVGADLWFTGADAAEGTAERKRQRALKLLAEWDGEMNEHLPEPLIYAAWMRALQHRLMQDELGPLADSFSQLEPVFIERVYRNIEGASKWCDVIQSAPIETCTDIARTALDDALLELSQKYGDTVESWRWGDAHEARHDHAVLGRVPVLQWFTNIRQSTSGGDFTLNRGGLMGTGDTPYANVHGASYRGVYDFADPDSSVFIVDTGQSGHPLSRHYDDMAELWRRGEYVPMSLDPALARGAAAGITKLRPLN
ncbi:penicillin acylase family protein [Albirhodobacter sp. R86504]|uniref:penicillin acylase family protein n=1 Tax=Albirhodobacter sp. R86504 TaxID=3093848 RepID=UPI00366D846C